MNRRGRHAEAFSLFAFQDVMASIIGILFFIVLLISFDIVNQKALPIDAPRESVSDSDLQVRRQRIDDLQHAISQLQEDIRKASQLVQMTTADEGELLAGVQGLDRTLRGTYARIAESQKTVTDIEEQTRRKHQEQQDQLQELDGLNRRAAELRQRLKMVAAAPRLAYIIDARPDGRVPWLIEVSAKEYRVAPHKGLAASLAFRADSLKDRTKLLLEWAATQDPAKFYFCVLVKPSGAAQAAYVETQLDDMGFELGRDLLPEDWNLLPDQPGG